MMVRLILAILSTLMEEAALVVLILWGLPQVGIRIPLPGLIALMVAWAAFSVFTYRKGSQALKRQPVVGLPTMIGGKGKVVSPLAREGMVRVKGELWGAVSIGGTINTNEEVTVVGQDGLKLIVRRSNPADIGRPNDTL